MNAYLLLLNVLASGWWSMMFPACCQAAIVGLLLLLIVALGRQWPAPIRYGLLTIALIKFMVPPLFTIPLWNATVPQVHEYRSSASDFQASARNSDRYAVVHVADLDGQLGSENVALQSAPRIPQRSRNIFSFASQIPMESLALLLYLFGVSLSLGWLVNHWLTVRRILSNAQPVSDKSIRREYEQLCQQLGISRQPTLLKCVTDVPPFATGVLFPRIVLSEKTLQQLSRPQVRTVLAHELSHHLRGDCWISVLQAALFIVWWFHPVYWVLNRKLVELREDCCDDLLLARWPGARSAYCNALVLVAKLQNGSLPLASGTSLPTHQLVRRLRRIVDDSIDHSRNLSKRSWLLLLLIAAVLLPGIRSLSSAEPKPDEGAGQAKAVHAIRSVGGTVTRAPDGNVVGVTFWKSDVIDRDLTSLRQFPRLKSIHCRGTLVGDAGLGEIANIETLEVLYLEGCKRVTDDGIRQLSELPVLKDLGIGNTSVSDKGLESIASFKKLEKLEVSGCPITDKGVMQLVELENLRLLFLSRMGKRDSLVSKETVEILEDFLPRCKIIHEVGNPIEARLKAERAAADAQAQRVERLRRIRAGFLVKNAEEAVAAIKSLPAAVGKAATARPGDFGDPQETDIADVDTYDPKERIVFVDLDNYGVDDEFVAHLQFLPDLEVVSVSRNPISDDSVKTLGQMKMLRVLHLDGTNVTDEGLRHLSELKHLTNLRLTNTNISDEGLKHLSDLTSLKELILWNTRITDIGLGHLASLENLEHIGLVQTQISDAGFQKLRKLPKLKWIDVRATTVSKSAVDSLMREMPECQVDYAPDYHFTLPR